MTKNPEFNKFSQRRPGWRTGLESRDAKELHDSAKCSKDCPSNASMLGRIDRSVGMIRRTWGYSARQSSQ